MTRRVRRLERSAGMGSFLLASALLLSACSDDTSSPSDNPVADSGVDDTKDAASDTDANAELDAGSDAAVEPDASEELDASEEFDASEEPDANVDLLPTATPAELADVSADNYADNKHGLITGATLANWISNWPANRPAGVTGKLVVLQVVPNVANSQTHVAGDGTNVVSYLVAQSELTQLRNNGLSQIEAEIPNGESADTLLKKYGIDALQDFVVVTFEQLPAVGAAPATANAIVQQAARAWLLLRYWGYAKDRIALLNGSVNWNSANEELVLSTDVPATPPNNGSVSVRELRTDNTQFVITLDGLLGTLKNAASATPRNKTTIVDARGGAEALGLLKSTSTGKTDCPSYDNSGANTRCSPLFEGRIKGAYSVPWTQFLDTSANGFRFFSKATVKDIFDTQSEYKTGNVVVQYCRTNVRSMVTGVVSSVILGYPTRFYDTSFIEWSHLAYGPTAKTQTLPEASAYRTDLATFTEHATVTGYTPGLPFDPDAHTITGWIDGPNYNLDADISDTPILLVPASTTASQSVIDDRAYKLAQP